MLEINPRSPQVENAVLKRLGEAPISIGRANLAFLLIKAYVIAGQAALQKAAKGSEELIIFSYFGPTNRSPHQPPSRL